MNLSQARHGDSGPLAGSDCHSTTQPLGRLPSHESYLHHIVNPINQVHHRVNPEYSSPRESSQFSQALGSGLTGVKPRERISTGPDREHSPVRVGSNDMDDNETKRHEAYDSALENVLDARGYTSGEYPLSAAEAVEREAAEQARDLIDCGECYCSLCVGSNP